MYKLFNKFGICIAGIPLPVHLFFLNLMPTFSKSPDQKIVSVFPGNV
jgi:hypothetical protein